MIIVKFHGGLGNQMFEYALYRKLELVGKNVKADVSWYYDDSDAVKRTYLLPQFGIQINECRTTEKKKYDNIVTRFLNKHLNGSRRLYVERESGVYQEEILDLKNCFLDGYWQTEKYFSDIRDSLLSDFKFPDTVNKEESALLDKIKKCQSVSIHIRRGDYLANEKKYGNICTEEYYFGAIRYMVNSLTDAQFFVFSDDIKWCRDFLKSYKNINYVDLGKKISEIHDMKLMSVCKHNIIANSSFSWWASWLNQNEDKIVIAPDRWKNGCLMPDIACKEWIRLGNKGE